MPGRFALFIVVAVLVSACGSDSGGTPDKSVAPDGGVSEPSITAPANPAEGGPGGRPSGAQVRVVNVYAPLTGDPGPIDVYAEPWASSGDPVLITVPYGTISDPFDPTVADEQGDMFLSFYRAGETGNGNEVISKTETLKGGEAFTYIVGTGASTQADGGRFAALQPFFSRAADGDTLESTPAPGTGQIVVTSVGLDNVLADPEAESWFLGLGDGCTKAVGNDEYTQTAVNPGSGGIFDVPPGTYSATIHAYPSDYSGEIPDCSNASIIGDVPISIAEGTQTVLVLYAPADGDLRSLVVPPLP